MRDNGFVFEVDVEGLVICFDDHLFRDGPWGYGVEVSVKAHGVIRVDLCRGGVPAVGEVLGQRSHECRIETLYGLVAGGAMDSYIGHMVPPMIGLSLDILKVGEGS